jgi:hypothetical protein
MVKLPKPRRAGEEEPPEIDNDLPGGELKEHLEEKSAEETYNEHNAADAQEWPAAKQCQCDACEEHRGNE